MISPTTALMAAAVKGRTEIVKALLDHKADVNIQDRVDMNALSYANGRGNKRSLLYSKRAGAKEPKKTEPKPR
jgi:ankyrin repeat protein